jgi:hypothetical protein
MYVTPTEEEIFKVFQFRFSDTLKRATCPCLGFHLTPVYASKTILTECTEIQSRAPEKVASEQRTATAGL